MPYKIRGKCVFKQTSSGLQKKGCSSTVSGAKKYLQVLNMREHGVPPKGKEKK